MKATEPSGVINEMLKFGSAGWNVFVMALSKLPSVKPAKVLNALLRAESSFSAMMPRPVSEFATRV